MSSNRGGCCGCLSTVFSLLFLWIAFSWFVSCGRLLLSLSGSTHQKELAEKAVLTHHARMNEGKCQEIYDQASKGLKRWNSQQDVIRACERSRQDLGVIKSTQLDSSSFGVDNEGVLITLTYNTTFANSLRKERFIWRIESNQAVLDSYELLDDSTPPSPTSVSR